MIQNSLHPAKYRNKFKTDFPEQSSVKDLRSTEMAGGGNITYATQYKAG